MMLKSVHLFFPGNRYKICLFSFIFNVEYLKEGVKISTATSSFKMRCSWCIYVLLDSYSEIWNWVLMGCRKVFLNSIVDFLLFLFFLRNDLNEWFLMNNKLWGPYDCGYGDEFLKLFFLLLWSWGGRYIELRTWTAQLNFTFALQY